MLTDEEQDWLSMLQRDDEKAMQLISTSYYEELYNTAFNLLERKEKAKEITDKVFFTFWKNRRRTTVMTSLKRHLKGELVADCVKWLRYEYKIGFPEQVPDSNELPPLGEINFDFEEDSRSLIGKIVASMPERNKVILRMKRHESYKIHEIATELKTTNEMVEFYLLQSVDLIRKGLVRFG